MTRLSKAEKEYSKAVEKYLEQHIHPECLDETVSDEDAEIYDQKYNAFQKTAETRVREKYGIPEGVHLSGYEDWCEWYTLPRTMAFCKPYIAAFVKGKLTEESCANLIHYFDDFNEMDYGWILLEQSSGFYGAGGQDCDIEAIEAEIMAIGTRSKSKARNLPDLMGNP